MTDRNARQDQGATPFDLKPRCSTCVHFVAPNEVRVRALEKIGMQGAGDCVFNPVIVKKTPEDWCGQHPLMVQARDQSQADFFAKKVGDEFEKFLDRVQARAKK